jgi:hypothetical protein
MHVSFQVFESYVLAHHNQLLNIIKILAGAGRLYDTKTACQNNCANGHARK